MKNDDDKKPVSGFPKEPEYKPAFVREGGSLGDITTATTQGEERARKDKGITRDFNGNWCGH